jgi:hypothetical protein
VLSGSNDPHMIGFTYTERRAPTTTHTPYFFYRNLGTYRGRPLLFVEIGTSDGHEFSRLGYVTLSGESVGDFDTLVAGDRCMGGIFNIALNRGRLSYDERVDARLLAQLVLVVGHDVPDGIPYSPVDCYGVIHSADGKFLGVTLTRNSLPGGHNRSAGSQECLNSVYRDFVRRGQIELDRSGAEQFSSAYMRRCG